MKLAADANVLLSAVIGGRAKLALGHNGIHEVLTTRATFAEVEEYAPLFAKKKRISVDILLLAVAAQPVTVVEQDKYSKQMPQALKRIGGRDLEDADLLALAIHFRIPI